jgi:hypothetical protein
VQTTRHELIETLSILRRPQTKADLDTKLLPGILRFALLPAQFARRHEPLPPGLKRFLARMGDPKLDRALARVVTIPAWHAKVGIEPITYQPSRTSSQRAEGLDLNLWIGTKATIPPSSEDGTGPRPTALSTIRAHGLALADRARGTDRLDVVVLVPDGVARVTLTPIRIIRSPVNVNPTRLGHATAPVHENIAALQLYVPTVTDRRWIAGTFGTSALMRATWFNASGNVIKDTTTNLDVLIKVIGGKRFPSP